MNAPEAYVASSASQRYDAAEWIGEFRDKIKVMHGRIMDIGCGPGDTTRDLILPNLPDDAVIVGTDISAEMLKYAEEHNKDETRISFLQLNIESNELPMNLVGKYDNVVSFDCLHWCKKIKVACNNIYKLLRSGGTALIVCTSDHTAFEIYLNHRNSSKYSVYMQDGPNYLPVRYGSPNPEESLRKDLEEAGFEVLHCTNRLRTYTFKNLENFLDLLMSVSPFVNRMPDDLKKEYRNDVKAKVMEKSLISQTDSHLDDCPYADTYAEIAVYVTKPGRNDSLHKENNGL